MKFPFTEIIGYLQAIVETGKQNKKILQNIERIQDKDREDFRELTNKVNHLQTEFNSFKEVVNKLPNETRDKLAEAAEPIITEASDLKNAINAAEIIPVDKKTREEQKKPWWKIR